MRLIDADALLQEFETENVAHNSDMWHITGIKAFIENQPTAYNLDAVVEQLENGGQKMAEAKSMKPYGKGSPSCHRYYKAISVKKAVDIVRNGGKE